MNSLDRPSDAEWARLAELVQVAQRPEIVSVTAVSEALAAVDLGLLPLVVTPGFIRSRRWPSNAGSSVKGAT